jgi:hypothetical protein
VLPGRMSQGAPSRRERHDLVQQCRRRLRGDVVRLHPAGLAGHELAKKIGDQSRADFAAIMVAALKLSHQLIGELRLLRRVGLAF